MASTRTPSRVRLLLVLVAAGLVAASATVLPHIASADPGQPSIGEVTAKLDDLAHQSEVLTEQFNKATIDLKADQKKAAAAQLAAKTAAVAFDKARVKLSQTVTAAYESSSFSRAGALLTSQSGQSYLDTINALNMISTHRAAVVAEIDAAHTKAVAAQKTASTLVATATAKKKALDKQRSKVAAEQAKFKSLLNQLTAAQQQTYLNRNSVPPQQAVNALTSSPSSGVSAAAQKAVNYAIAQVGKSYVFAASGPDAFDCSGLTMMAWAQAGISLPHLASAQYDYGQHVSYDQLRPGDLIFLYSPISHVEIYIGNDLAVSAADEQLGIRYVHPSQDMADWAGATHIA